ncbi:hypothetical protein JAAARDRAFT_414479 [Jaapia argillacea MUCL 33604]|uniref:Uncharacterized protein n=1 Tax=Jaapia argillacea MUCL 33604 TaxID=933084 RepID=A0A067PJ31_9AGAM|nr:hypothetical protein JAAARDRAFT_414479 [Jaapia argillacea MUCL 33604]
MSDSSSAYTSRTRSTFSLEEDQDLLQNLADSEESFIQSLARLSAEFSTVSSAIESWGWAESHDFRDPLQACCTLLGRFSSCLNNFSSRIQPVRQHVEYILSTTKHLDGLKSRRHSLSSQVGAVERSMVGMNPYDSAVQRRLDELNAFKTQIREVNAEIMAKEASLVEFKRSTVRDWVSIMFGALQECSRKGSVIGEFGKRIIQDIPVTSDAGRSANYTGYNRTKVMMSEADRCINAVTFSPTFASDRSKKVKPGGGRRATPSVTKPPKVSGGPTAAPPPLSGSSFAESSSASNARPPVMPGGGRRHFVPSLFKPAVQGGTQKQSRVAWPRAKPTPTGGLPTPPVSPISLEFIDYRPSIGTTLSSSTPRASATVEEEDRSPTPTPSSLVSDRTTASPGAYDADESIEGSTFSGRSTPSSRQWGVGHDVHVPFPREPDTDSEYSTPSVYSLPSLASSEITVEDVLESLRTPSTTSFPDTTRFDERIFYGSEGEESRLSLPLSDDSKSPPRERERKSTLSSRAGSSKPRSIVPQPYTPPDFNADIPLSPMSPSTPTKKRSNVSARVPWLPFT